jgi:hypothetical protein
MTPERQIKTTESGEHHMQNQFWRAVATIVIWAAVTGIIITSFIMGSPSDVAVIAPLVAALLATLAMWVPGQGAAPTASASAASLEKAKRGQGAARTEEARMRMLLELMDPDEREAFKEILKQQMLRDMADGELPYGAQTLESLLDDQDEGKRLRR